MSGEYISSILSAIIGAAIGFIASLLTLKLGYKRLFAETVSKSRNEWLITMRENLAIMLSEADKCQDDYKTKEYFKARNEVMLRLNMDEEYCIMLESEIKALDCCKKSDFIRIRDNIIKISQKMFKQEWEKVKSEAKGV